MYWVLSTYQRNPGRNSGIFLCNLISSHYLCTVNLKTPRNMKKVISKLDGKEYYLTVCNDESNVMFICNKRYQVRNATSDDCCNPELYCVVNGTFNEPLSDLDFKIASGGLLPLNRYNGTYCLNKKVLKSDCKRYLSYID